MVIHTYLGQNSKKRTVVFLGGRGRGLKIGGKEFWELFSKNSSLIFFLPKNTTQKCFFLFLVLMPKQKKSGG